MNRRERFLRWFFRDVLGLDANEQIPRGWLWLMWALLPGRFICYLAAKVYDPSSDTVTIEGICFSRRALLEMKNADPNTGFRVVRYDKDTKLVMIECFRLTVICGERATDAKKKADA